LQGVRFSDTKRLEVSLDFFNLFNSSAAFGFVSADGRSARFGVKTNFVPARVAQFGTQPSEFSGKR